MKPQIQSIYISSSTNLERFLLPIWANPPLFPEETTALVFNLIKIFFFLLSDLDGVKMESYKVGFITFGSLFLFAQCHTFETIHGWQEYSLNFWK